MQMRVAGQISADRKPPTAGSWAACETARHCRAL